MIESGGLVFVSVFRGTALVRWSSSPVEKTRDKGGLFFFLVLRSA